MHDMNDAQWKIGPTPLRFTVWLLWLNTWRLHLRKKANTVTEKQTGKKKIGSGGSSSTGPALPNHKSSGHAKYMNISHAKYKFMPSINSPRHQWFFKWGLEPQGLRRKWGKVYTFTLLFARIAQIECVPNMQNQWCVELKAKEEETQQKVLVAEKTFSKQRYGNIHFIQHLTNKMTCACMKITFII